MIHYVLAPTDHHLKVTVLRPWGSACTIIAFTFFQLKKVPSSNVAGMLLSGILSDTLNLKGPTTTSTDRMMVAALARIANVV